MGEPTILHEPGGIEEVPLAQALEERYLAYALSTIMHRALPDVRDGLKPVHRRLLYAMRQLRLDPGSGFKKSARVVGDVIGKYHPHGDVAVYDALVRLAQDFAQRYPLIDGQGNFGNVDGDGAAAMRYTEARLTGIAALLLEGIDEDSVDFRATYDGEEREPVVLPANFPNLLANGASGIAVGMATSIPPHNVAELCDAALHLIKHPNATVDALASHVPGPDFPTGGLLVEPPSSILESYRTGRGSFRVRARWTQEDAGRGTWVVVITEIPYQVQKARLIERIAELIQARKVPLLADVRDESAEDIRVVLEPRARNVDAGLLMEQLFRLTDLETRFPLNMNVLARGQVPMVMSLRDVLRHWLDHRRVVLLRRSNFRLAQIAHRLEILEGYLIAYLNLDEVIRIIRETDEPKPALIAAFGLTDVQAEAILNMRLRALRRLEEMEIRREHEKLTAEREGLDALVGSEARQWTHIASEVRAVRKTYGPETPLGRRRTELAEAPETPREDVLEALIEREPVTIVLSEKGWLRALRGHVQDLAQLTFKGEDRLKLHLLAETTDKLLMVATDGRVYTLSPDKLPGGRGHGEPLRLLVEMGEGCDVATMFVHRPGAKRLIASTDGRGFVVGEDAMIANTRKGKQVMTVSGKVEVALCVPAGGDTGATVGDNRKLLVFPMAQVAEMARGRGVRLQRYRDGGISDARVFDFADGLTFTDSSGRVFTVKDKALEEWRGDRGAAGRLPPKGFPRSNKFDGRG